MANRKFTVVWTAELVLESEVECLTAKEAERLAMGNMVSLREAEVKECVPTSAHAE